MSKERILTKKFDRINELKTKLVSRSEESREDIIEDIKETMEDLELALEDFGYINTSDENREEEEDNENVEVNLTDIENVEEIDMNQYREMKKLTLDEVSKYDGKDGRPAYVVIEGTVYDVTGNAYWKDGQHFGTEAGGVVTNTFYSCHAKSMQVLKKLQVVGVLAE